MALTVLEVFKILPQTNCGDCGQSTCPAFATRVVKEGKALENCPHLAPTAQEVARTIKAQQRAGLAYLTISYFNQPVQVFKDQVRCPPEMQEDPWDAILLYNYIASQGQQPPTGQWIAFQSLPDSVWKAKTLARLEAKLTARFSGDKERLRQQAGRGGSTASRTRGGGGRSIYLPAFAPGPALADVLGCRGGRGVRGPDPVSVRRSG